MRGGLQAFLTLHTAHREVCMVSALRCPGRAILLAQGPWGRAHCFCTRWFGSCVCTGPRLSTCGGHIWEQQAGGRWSFALAGCSPLRLWDQRFWSLSVWDL